MRGPYHGYWYDCASCDYLASDLQPGLGSGTAAHALDEVQRQHALEALRQANFETVLDVLSELGHPPSARLLDVGCAHGWFLDAARARGFFAEGLEPDSAIAAVASAKNHPVRPGFFPDALPSGDRFDVITFHDVFEHLPEPALAASAVHACLRPGGLLVLNLPSRRGALFRLASLVARTGLRGPLERLWQRGFPSPHRSYFSPDGLATLMAANGMQEVYRGTLPSVSRTGLWARLRYDNASSLPASIMLWPLLYGFSLVMPLLPADIALQVFQRAPGSPTA